MRADLYLFENGYAESRQSAKNRIISGAVTIDGVLVRKPAFEVDEAREHRVVLAADLCPYVSRGGLKLAGAMEAFGLSADGAFALDIGASTGGFTDCLLQNGAAHVWAVDSGSAQLHQRLRNDPRVTVMENTNARHLSLSDFGRKFDWIVMDVSFISQTLILPSVADLLDEDGVCVTLIKPQFEVGRENVGKNGIVKGEKLYRLAIQKVTHAAEQVGLICVGLIPSPIRGGDGNAEFLARFARKGFPCTPDSIFER